MYTIIVSSRGQVVIPAEARKKLNIKEGDVLSVHIEEGGRLVIKPRRKERAGKGTVERTAGLLSDMEISGLEYVESIRKGSGRRLDELENRN
ncbi:MAG TPA: AbrB/MazE/SpoVT family DNA-binding domain-containing protein [Bacillota bacterium]|nr:AbrB/MazE/SpoVT family DNA-binding domain-containing protein [Bacillota bacterium]